MSKSSNYSLFDLWKWWMVLGFSAPYFVIPFLIQVPDSLKLFGSLYLGFGSMWWLWIMGITRKLQAMQDYPPPKEY